VVEEDFFHASTLISFTLSWSLELSTDSLNVLLS
jgi:hypothetical protein